MNVLDAIRQRKSTRAYLDKPVAETTIEAILDAARWSPSGTNTQPWHVCVVSGKIQAGIAQALSDAFCGGEETSADYRYYTGEKLQPYYQRQFQCGMDLYGALGIDRKDREKRREAWDRNYRFFGAPAGLFFFIDERLEKGSWMDMGMFIQSVMLAAKDFGLDTCPQFSLAEYPDIVRRILEAPDSLKLVCGMAIGYADPVAPVNNYRTSREEVKEFTRWFDGG